MKKIKTSIPVFFESIEDAANNRYSIAKLKVFYTGETADHRLFTKSFADKIIKTLPSTPVVGYYSEEKDDFIGHNETQYVYGHVPECATGYFEEDAETGNNFYVTEVYLYTERQDNIGSVAKKIVGKQHSLELNPKTLKYKVNREGGKFKNFEFLDGDFIGLSVLGDDQNPAFPGSGFFTVDENFKEFSDKCHQNFDKFLEFLNKSGGQIEVFNSEDFFKDAGEFLARTVQEEQVAIYDAMYRDQIDGYVVENTSDYVVIQVFEDNCVKPYKYDLIWEGDQATLSNPRSVRARYLTDEELESIQSDVQPQPSAEAEEQAVKVQDEDTTVVVETVTAGTFEEVVEVTEVVETTEETQFEEEEVVVEENSEETNNEQQDCTVCGDDDEEKKKHECESTTSAQEEVVVEEDVASNAETIEGEVLDVQTTAEPVDATIQQELATEQVVETAASNSIATLSDSERAELEQFRRERKESLINTYCGDLADSILASYREQVDNFSYEELESKLAVEFRKAAKLQTKREAATNQFTVAPFTMFAPAGNSHYDEHNPADVINTYKK